MKKPSNTGAGGKPEPVAIDSGVKVDVPNLVAFLADTVWDDKSPREPGSILLVASEGRWKAWVNDRGLHRTAWVSGDTLEGLLESLEEKFASDDFEWRRARPVKGK